MTFKLRILSLFKRAGEPHHKSEIASFADKELCSCHFSRAQAAGAHMNRFVGSADNSPDCSYIGFPSSVGFAVRVRNVVTEDHAFSADITLSHYRHLHISELYYLDKKNSYSISISYSFRKSNRKSKKIYFSDELRFPPFFLKLNLFSFPSIRRFIFSLCRKIISTQTARANTILRSP